MAEHLTRNEKVVGSIPTTSSSGMTTPLGVWSFLWNILKGGGMLEKNPELNKLDQDFGVLSLLKFTGPSIIMLVFVSMYVMVDAVFVSNFVGSDALSALNIVYPVTSVVLAVSVMLATGGGAIIAKNMGEGKDREAREKFSLLILTGLVLGVVLTVFGIVFLDPLLHLMGATPKLYRYCYDYIYILLLATTLYIFQLLFQTFLVTAGKPHLGLAVTVVGGLSNVVFDYLFIVRFGWGVQGAALATSIGYALPALFGLVYFSVCRRGTLFFVRPKWRKKFLIRSCTNGASEMVTNLAVAITTFLFNIMMLRYVGEDGVAAITIVLYAQFLMTSVFMGYSGGLSPIISYNYGCGNHHRQKKIFRISMGFVGTVSVLVFVLSLLFRREIIGIFTPADSSVFPIAMHGFVIFSISFLFTGLNIYASAMFTAFSNGFVSAVISFLRTFLFLSVCLLGLPRAIGPDGIWWAVPVAEGLSIAVVLWFFGKLKNEYHYM